MIRKHQLLSAIGLGLLVSIFPSCTDDDDSYELLQPTALVTVRPNTDGSFIMQLDNTTQLIPENLKTSPYGSKEVRALVNYTELDNNDQQEDIRTVHVNWLDSIRTKMPVASAGIDNDNLYGNDPVEIVKDWVTIAEDGYLTLRIRTVWGMSQVTHSLNLLTGINPDDPFELELRHDAKGDTEGRWGDALIAFNLNQLPRNDSDNATIKLKWKSFNGEKSAQVEIQLRPSTTDVNTEHIRYSKYIE